MILFDPENNVIKLCTHGMQSKGKSQHEKASVYFNKRRSKLKTIWGNFYCFALRSTSPEKRWSQIDLG